MYDFSFVLCILMKGFVVFLFELIYQKLLFDYNNNIYILKNVKYRYEYIFLYLVLFRKL